MPRALFSWISFFFFITFIFVKDHYTTESVSPETRLSEQRAALSIKTGVTPDGAFSLTQVSSPPFVPLFQRVSNHERNLRAYIGDPHGCTLYVEQSKPHNYYVLEGDFVVSPLNASLAWLDQGTLMFYGLDSSGTPEHYFVDVRQLVAHKETVSEIPPQEELRRIVDPVF